MSRKGELDQYFTPAWAVDLILPEVPRGRVVDPFAGDGAIIRRAAEVLGRKCFGFDIDPALENGWVVCRDSLAQGKWFVESPDPWAVVTNPPYNRAQEAIERCLVECDTVFALLRLGFVAGQRRKAFWQAHPADVFVLPRRPSFTNDGKTDASEYAWFAWGPGRGGHWKRLDV
jgi:hypothetical protein